MTYIFEGWLKLLPLNVLYCSLSAVCRKRPPSHTTLHPLSTLQRHTLNAGNTPPHLVTTDRNTRQHQAAPLSNRHNTEPKTHHNIPRYNMPQHAATCRNMPQHHATPLSNRHNTEPKIANTTPRCNRPQRTK